VLIVDDREAVRGIVARMLGRLGFETVACPDGREAWAAFHRHTPPGAVPPRVLDLTIPGGMGGLETLAALKAIDPAVTAVVSSGYSEDAAMADARGFGFAGALKKPFRMAELDDLLERLGLDGEPAP
jgi:CheY-like chemotaxis protein